MQSTKADFYVSTEGNDAWSGTLPASNQMGTDGPFASIHGAQKAVRKLRSTRRLRRPLTVLIHEGTYRLTKPIIFRPEDSGTKSSPTVYAAYPREKVVISGGRKITGWKRGKGGLWSAEVPEVKSGKWYFRDLYVNNQRRRRPRVPKLGFRRVADVVAPDVKNAFHYAEGDIRPWRNMEDMEVVFFNAWDESRLRIAQLDEQTHTVTFTGPNNWSLNKWEAHSRYYVENVFEALHELGQWYLDRKTGILYYWPMPGETINKVEVVAPVVEELVRFDGDVDNQRFVEHVHLRGLTLYHAGWSLPPEGYSGGQAEAGIGAAVVANGARLCSVEDCEIAHVGKYAIEFARGCQDNRIAGSHIHDMGAGGVKIGEPVIRENEFEHTCRNEVSGNHIHDGGHVYLCGVGVWIGRSANNNIIRNHIHDLNYTGISVGWTWGYAPSLAIGNRIEYNHIHDIGRGLLSDMGGIYTLGVSPGTVLRHNLIHDIVSYSYGGWGIYLDEGSTDILVENNVVYNTKSGGLHQHYGKENIIRNNVFALGKEGQIHRTRQEPHLSFTFERNIVYWTEGPLLRGNWQNDRFRLDNNLYWNAARRGRVDFAGASFDEWKDRGMDVHSLIADPLFADPGKGDFTPKPDSPAFGLGFQAIDMQGIKNAKQPGNQP